VTETPETYERRAESRFRVDSPATITTLREPFANATCRLIDVSKNGMRLATAEPFGVGVNVKIQFQDSLVLGEVLRCSAENKEFVLGISIENAFFGVITSPDQLD
jgi:hypothetical protein